MPIRPSLNSETEQLLATMPRRVLQVPTLQMRGDDRRDIYEIAVWDLAQALREGFEAGRCTRGSDFPNNIGAQPLGCRPTSETQLQGPGTIIPFLHVPNVWVVARSHRPIAAGQNPGQGSPAGLSFDRPAFWDGQMWRSSADEALPFESFNEATEFIQTHRRRLIQLGEPICDVGAPARRQS